VNSQYEASHIVHFYDDASQLIPALARHVGAALRLGLDALVIARPHISNALSLEVHREHIRASPFGHGRGRLTLLDAKTVLARFMKDGWPDDALFDQHVGALVRAATTGSRAAAAFGEMVALLCEEGRFDAALRLEQLWNDLIERHRLALLCAYPKSLFDSEAGRASYAHVCAAHQQQLLPV
jgi:hypothetical protein